jgi:hypothetical protein
MMSLFANNLQAMLTEGAPPAPEAAGEPIPEAVPTPVPASAAEPIPAPVPEPVPASATAAPGGSLDALSLAKGIAADQLSNPVKVVGIVAVVACIAYWAGRRSAFRLLRLCGRL